MLPIALMAGATGARTMTGVAAATRGASRGIANTTAGLAAFELVMDKLPGIPDRIAPSSLLARLVAGAVIGGSVAAMTGHDRTRAALTGATVAFVSAHVTFRLRRALSQRLPPLVAALVEDAAAIAVASAGAALVRDGAER